MKGKSPFVADAEHIHHKLLKAGFSQKNTVAILTSVAIVGGAIASYSVGSIKHYLVYICALVLIMFALSLVNLYNNNNKNKNN